MVQITKSVKFDTYPKIGSQTDGWMNVNLRVPKPVNPAATELDCVGLVSYHIPTKPYFTNAQTNENKFRYGCNLKKDRVVQDNSMSYKNWDNLMQAVLGPNPPQASG